MSGMMRSSGNEAPLVMDAGGASLIVVINKEALLDVAVPRRCDESRRQERIYIFSEIASAEYDRGELER